ncbi:GIN domain-containing protein [Pedobacter sp. NJ-S-72]
MKTAIKTLLATALTAIVLTSSAFATYAKDGDKNPPVLMNTANFSMIKVEGNVRVYLSQGNKENISIETNQSGEKVSLKRQGQKLLISATGDQMVDVYLTVKNLVRIDASGNAIVKSNGRLELTNLQIFLQNEAKANVEVTARDIYTVIKDESSLKLSGSTALLTSIKDDASKLNTKNFAATASTSSRLVFGKIDLERQFADSLSLVSLSK